MSRRTFSLLILCFSYLFIIPYLHKTVLHGLPPFELYALLPLSTPVSWLNGFDPVFFEVISDLLFSTGFLVLLFLWWILFRKIGDLSLQRLLIIAFAVGLYLVHNVLAHSFAS